VHIRAAAEDIAPVVLLPGDPGRATRAAEMLQGARCYSDNRGLIGYTGTYKGTSISVQTTGMGGPSAAIVVEELAMLGARIVVRIGTCGGVQPQVRPKDLIIATAACPLDGTASQYLGGDAYAPAAAYRVVRALMDSAERARARHHAGLVATEDALYAVTPGWAERWGSRGVLAQEMEASAILTVAALRGMEAGVILTASNTAGEHERLPDDELSPAIDTMIGVALEAAVDLASALP
jgi:purine-nucleoside phosphorylase